MTQGKDKTLLAQIAGQAQIGNTNVMGSDYGFGGVSLLQDGAQAVAELEIVELDVSQPYTETYKQVKNTHWTNITITQDADHTLVRTASGEKHVLFPDTIENSNENATTRGAEVLQSLTSAQLSATTQVVAPAENASAEHTNTEPNDDLLTEQYLVIAQEYLQDTGLKADQNVDPTPSVTRLTKETVTHYGSCGPNSCVIGFCIAVLENKINADHSQNYSKLVQSWNTTYPDDAAGDAEALFAKIREKLSSGNTVDMENLMGPVVRVYYGIAMQMKIRSSEDPDNCVPRLSDDEDRAWDIDHLNNGDYQSIRDEVGLASAKTIEDLYNNQLLALDEVANPLSFAYFFDQSDLEIIAKELLNISFVRATQMDININEYREIDHKIKTNQKVIEKAQEKQLVGNESSGRLEADPHDVAKKLCSSGESVEYYRFNQDEPSYKAWQKFRSAVQLNWISRESDIVKRIDEAAKSAEQKGISFNAESCKQVCEQVIVSAIEHEFLSQLSDGNNIISDLSSAASDGIHVVHSGEVYWDALIPHYLFQKYSREAVASKYASQPMQANDNVAELFKVAGEYFHDSHSLLPYLNLTTKPLFVNDYGEDMDYMYDGGDDDEDEFIHLINAISSLCHSITAVTNSIHLVVFALCSFLIGIAGSAVFTLGLIAYQTYSHMNADTTTPKSPPSTCKVHSSELSSSHVPHDFVSRNNYDNDTPNSDFVLGSHSGNCIFNARGENKHPGQSYRPVTA